MKNKGWVMFGIVIAAIIVAFAVYKFSSTTNTTITTDGGSVTHSSGGLASLIPDNLSLSIFGI